MTEAKNPLVKLRTWQRMTCYNGYIGELHRWTTREQFVAYCLEYLDIRNPSRYRKAKTRKLAEAAWDWWFQS